MSGADQAYYTIPIECRTGMYGGPHPRPLPSPVTALRHRFLAPGVARVRSLVTARNIVTLASYSSALVLGIFILGTVLGVWGR